jgi:hypothetical protein
MTVPELLVLIDVGYFGSEIAPVAEVGHDPFFPVADDDNNIGNSVRDERSHHIIHYRLVRYGDHHFRLGVREWPESLPLAGCKYDRFQFIHSLKGNQQER